MGRGAGTNGIRGGGGGARWRRWREGGWTARTIILTPTATRPRPKPPSLSRAVEALQQLEVLDLRREHLRGPFSSPVSFAGPKETGPPEAKHIDLKLSRSALEPYQGPRRTLFTTDWRYGASRPIAPDW